MKQNFKNLVDFVARLDDLFKNLSDGKVPI